jgi:hypothetical protein
LAARITALHLAEKLFQHTRQGGMPRNVLLIPDDPANAKSVQEALTNSSDESFQLEWVRGDQAITFAIYRASVGCVRKTHRGSVSHLARHLR